MCAEKRPLIERKQLLFRLGVCAHLATRAQLEMRPAGSSDTVPAEQSSEMCRSSIFDSALVVAFSFGVAKKYSMVELNERSWHDPKGHSG